MSYELGVVIAVWHFADFLVPLDNGFKVTLRVLVINHSAKNPNLALYRRHRFGVFHGHCMDDLLFDFLSLLQLDSL